MRRMTQRVLALVVTIVSGTAHAEGLVTSCHFYLLQADGLSKRVRGDDAQKRAAAIDAIAAANADTVVLDQYYSDSPSAAGFYTPDELLRIRAGSSSARTLLCYFSVGEAEDYRPYWNTAWDARHDGKPDAGAPSFLLEQNKQFKGNYRVKYWSAEWLALLMGSEASPLDRILAQGFDGMYLDIIDGFESFEDGEDNKLNPETGQTYRRDMVDLVRKLAEYARARKPGFFVIPQNGTQLLDFDDHVATISGQGQEDLYYFANKLNKDTAETVARLKKVRTAGKAVLITDYPTAKRKQDDDIARAQSDGFSIFIARRQLNTLGREP